MRESKLARSNTKSDEVVKNFFDNFPEANILVWVNTTTPFINAKLIKKIVKFYIKKKIDTLITSEKKFAHTNYKNKPLNYKKSDKFSRTQDLIPIQLCNYAIMIWRRSTFLKSYARNKSGILSGKVFFFPIDPLSAVMIKNKKDFELAYYIMKKKKKNKIRYLAL